MKRLAIRCGLVVVLIIVGIFLFVVGKEHIVFIDNRELTIDGETYNVVAGYEVWVDGQQVGRTALAPGKRNVASVAGPKHRIELQEIKDKEPVGERIEKDFRIATRTAQVIINIPALVAGSESFIYSAEK